MLKNLCLFFSKGSLLSLQLTARGAEPWLVVVDGKEWTPLGIGGRLSRDGVER